ncbi:DUF4861 domain-containing protein [Fulvivirga ligni]|uniref:DUF4861 domain-containing protein n=1 Tax=Fulvivirga ligni TaxID=2904246 RepID=UPI001F37C855|nr:DUF4861 domain-containing protein [Fulvivirga ligni]UII23412.1 DUF4861 domain-containing protein [Fulvivirga ligni]
MSRNLWLAALVVLFGCNSNTKNESESTDAESITEFTVVVNNPLSQVRTGTLVMIKAADLPSNFNKNAFTVMLGEQEVPSQYNTKGEEGIAFVIDTLAAEAKVEYTIDFDVDGERKHDYPKRTQAELSIKKGGKFENREYMGGEFENIDSLRVPDEHTDHSWFIRYEGPGWESDLVGYRFYLDWRNATDVFGKTGHGMELQHVGKDNFDSYHELSDWGMDVLKVGESLGVGSIATYYNDKAMRVAETDSVISKVLENGPVYSAVQTDYFGWKVADTELDLESVISIHAGTRLSKEQLTLENSLENIATGLHKDKGTDLFTSEGDENSWGYLATYGAQSLNNDNLGLAILFPPKSLKNFTEDAHSHVVTLNPEGNEVTYYFLAAWEKEMDGITTKEQFVEYLNKTAKELAHPVEVLVTE